MTLHLLTRLQYILCDIFNFVSAIMERFSPERLLLNFKEFNNISMFNDSYCLKGLTFFCHSDFTRRIFRGHIINI